MKCPKCNQEALFVNGKYVCVDCGIEITPEEMFTQPTSPPLQDIPVASAPASAVPDPILENNGMQDIPKSPLSSDSQYSGYPQPEPSSEIGQNSYQSESFQDNNIQATSGSFSPNSGDENNFNADNGQAPLVDKNVEKPLENYYLNELNKQESPQVSPSQEASASSGIYDFSQDSGQKEVSGFSSPSLESPHSPSSSEATLGSGPESADEAVSSDLLTDSGSTISSASQEILPASESFPSAQTYYSATPEDQSPLGDSLNSSEKQEEGMASQVSDYSDGAGFNEQNNFTATTGQEDISAPLYQEEKTPLQDLAWSSQEGYVTNSVSQQESQPAPGFDSQVADPQPISIPNSSIDQGVGFEDSSFVQASSEDSLRAQEQYSSPQIAGQAPPVDMMEKGTTMDGFFSQDNIEKNAPMPSVESVFGGDMAKSSNPQDYGLPAPPPPNEKKKKIIMIASAAGVFLVGVIIAAFFLLREESNPYPIALDSENIKQLSSLVTDSMGAKKDISTNYEMEANLEGLTPREEGSEALRDVFSQPFSSSGQWLFDEEGNMHFLSSSGEQNIKQTFLTQERGTFSYNEETSSWVRTEGNTISKVPFFFEPSNLGLIFYVTNIKSATLAGRENLNNVGTTVYEIAPQNDFVKNLNFLGEPFVGASFISTDASGLVFKAWIGNEDRRIHKLEISGKVNVNGSDFSGEIAINSTANFSYQNVLIKNPMSEASDLFFDSKLGLIFGFYNRRFV